MRWVFLYFFRYFFNHVAPYPIARVLTEPPPVCLTGILPSIFEYLLSVVVAVVGAYPLLSMVLV